MRVRGGGFRGNRARGHTPVPPQYDKESVINSLGRRMGGARARMARVAAPNAPSHGLSSGPMIVAFHWNRLSSDTGDAEHPLGGSFWMLLKSEARRSVAMRTDDALSAELIFCVVWLVCCRARLRRRTERHLRWFVARTQRVPDPDTKPRAGTASGALARNSRDLVGAGLGAESSPGRARATATELGLR